MQKQNRSKKAGALLAGAFFLLSAAAFAQTDEDAQDAAFLNEGTSSGAASGNDDAGLDQAKWTFSGFLENENHVAVGDKKGAKDITKLEGRARLKARYGTEFMFAAGTFDVYFYPEFQSGANTNGNPQPNAAPEAQELYVQMGEKWQLKIGKQLYNWGTADAFKVTNYLDRQDLREMFTKDDEDNTQGVYSVSSKYIFGDLAVEGAFMPVHNAPLLPGNNSFWAIKLPKQTVTVGVNPMTGDPITTQIRPNLVTDQDAGPEFHNVAAAGRFGGTLGELDFHVSYFNGLDSALLFVPEQTATGINVIPDYRRINTAGLDLAYNIDKVAIRAETAFTPDKYAVKESNFNVKKTQFLAYTVGVDANLWGDEGRVLLEWTQSFYLKNADSLQDPFLSDILLLSVEDKFLDNRLEVQAGGLMRPTADTPSFVPTAEVGWNFQNGLLVQLGGYVFIAEDDDLLSRFEDNDFTYIRARMEF